MDNKKKIIIVGAGPGGLTAGLLLSSWGHDVEIFERLAVPGGRNSSIDVNGFIFDVGPTFLMMKFVLEDVFKEAGYNIKDYLKITDLSPMYRIFFKDRSVDIFSDIEKMKNELERKFNKETASGLDKFIKNEAVRYKYLYECLNKDYSYFRRFFEKEFVKSIPHLAIGKSLFGVLGKYFKNEDARLCFTFQSKYLGMSPWQCPGAFAMIPYIEHSMGIYHVEGGLSKISEVMADLIIESGGRINYNTPIKKVLLKDKGAIGVELENGNKIYGDKIIINSDFGYSMTNLFDTKGNKKYSKEKLKKKKYSCSTFMIYLGLDKIYKNIEHHNIIFANEYRKNVEAIFNGKFTNQDFSMYVRNASINDSTIAPQGCSQFYILIPAPNNNLNKDIDWKLIEEEVYSKTIEIIKQKLGISDLEQHIVAKKIISPIDWDKDYNVYYGATFNLAHNLMQMLWFRPRNKLEGFKNCFLVGGGTHPGSGLPTIYQSAVISSNMIIKEK